MSRGHPSLRDTAGGTLTRVLDLLGRELRGAVVHAVALRELGGDTLLSQMLDQRESIGRGAREPVGRLTRTVWPSRT